MIEKRVCEKKEERGRGREVRSKEKLGKERQKSLCLALGRKVGGAAQQHADPTIVSRDSCYIKIIQRRLRPNLPNSRDASGR